MSDEPENLTLVYLRRLDGKLDRVMEEQQDQAVRLRRVETALTRLYRDKADGFNRRLDLTEA